MSHRVRLPHPWQRMVWAGAESTFAPVGCTMLALFVLREEYMRTIASLYFGVIILTTLRWGLRVGVFAAVLSYFLLDYYFLPPQGSFDLLDDSRDWIEFVVFVSCAVLVGRLVDRVREEATEAREREQVSLLVAGMLNAFYEADGIDDLLSVVVTWASKALSLQDCAIFRSPSHDAWAPVVQAGLPSSWTENDSTHARDALGCLNVIRIDEGQMRRLYMPLISRGQGIGVLGAKISVSEPSLLNNANMQLALSLQIGVAIEHAHLRAEATEAEVLRRTDELKSTLLSLVSHELRTPLTIIKTASETLQDNRVIRDVTGARTLLTAIGQEADHLQLIVGNLLDLSRIEGGALRLRLEWYDVGELAREAVDHLHSSLGGHVVDITAEPDLPPIQVDYLLVESVVTNLVLNAHRFSPPTDPIRVWVERVGQAIRLVVWDKGPGVLPTELTRIFERFYPRPGTRTGVGLGLALCKAIVEAHQGQIWAESDPDNGKGLIVTASFPFYPALLERQPSESPKHAVR